MLVTKSINQLHALKRKGKVTLTITAAPGILVVMPRPTNTAAFLEDNKIMAFVALDEVNRHAHSYNCQLEPTLVANW
jgi:hypothetical protein